MEPKTATIHGIRMAWHEAGRGVPLILVHGIPTNPMLWRHVVPRVRGGHCFAWEMIGHGSLIPEGRDRDIGIAAQAEYLRQWMDDRRIERAALVGHDLGGGVVQLLATLHPQRCLGLLLTNSIGYDAWPIPSLKAIRAMRVMVCDCQLR